MIRDAVIHIANEQPLMADLFALPSPSDVGLLCTNLRTMNGSRPAFADHIESTFFFPFVTIRFVEIAQTGDADGDRSSREGQGARTAPPGLPPEADIEIDEELLRRVREL